MLRSEKSGPRAPLKPPLFSTVIAFTLDRWAAPSLTTKVTACGAAATSDDAALSPQFAPMSTLEFGCGTGRLALPLAQRPGTVVAVDRSPAMLARARGEAERRGLGHIAFKDPAQLFAAPRPFDLVVCYHVLQRLRRDEAIALLRQLTTSIGPDGVGVFQWCCRTRQAVER